MANNKIIRVRDLENMRKEKEGIDVNATDEEQLVTVSVEVDRLKRKVADQGAEIAKLKSAIEAQAVAIEEYNKNVLEYNEAIESAKKEDESKDDKKKDK